MAEQALQESETSAHQPAAVLVEAAAALSVVRTIDSLSVELGEPPQRYVRPADPDDPRDSRIGFRYDTYDAGSKDERKRAAQQQLAAERARDIVRRSRTRASYEPPRGDDVPYDESDSDYCVGKEIY